MVNNIFLKCKICDSKFRMRWQIGFNIANFNIRCPECKAYFSGLLDSNNIQIFDKTLMNCEAIDECEPDYICEISTEFCCKKIYVPNKPSKYDITPFIRSVSYDDNYMERKKYLEFSKNIRKYKNELSTVTNLFENKSYKYLKSKLYDENDPFINICKNSIYVYKLKNDLDYLMAIHHYSNAILSLTKIDDTESNIHFVLNSISKIAKINTNKIVDFCKLIENRNIFSSLNNKFIKISEDFLNEYNNLLPIFIQQNISNVLPNIQ